MPETVGQRISHLISSLGISKNAFALSLDKTATVIQHLVDERNKPGFDLLCKIFEIYPKVSKDWLLQGQGQMLIDAPATREQPAAPLVEDTAPVATPSAEEKHSVAEASTSAPAASPTAAARVAPVVSRFVPKVGLPAAEPKTPTAAPSESGTPSAAASAAPEAPTLPASAPAVSANEPAPLPASVPAPPATGLTEANLQAALYAQQMGHQLAMAELRNQHLLDQQRVMQQMMELMQRQLNK